MELILIAALFMLQLLSFFWIAMLNTKLAKYKGLEQKQQKLIEEMDNSIGAYLLEMKEENDRLIDELKASSTQQAVPQHMLQNNEGERSLRVGEPLPVAPLKSEMVGRVPKTVVASVYERNIESQSTSFEQQKVNAILKQVEEKPQVLTFEQKVKKMYDEGQTIEQIAKNTNKGKTEIELLLKFSS